ncbi:rod shape-determining protein [Desulfonatronovibrio magnus]|uniref:rod shape-determining protein n=1 Tax=Desulfonatronovibrio magnus TaxID=698827 RepID=UPI0005EBE5A9|nr:rod shape-determining protein [Desulfonatronovibrio magnus]
MFFKKLFGLMGKSLAMDLGTANTLLYTPKNGIVLDEPSVVALDSRDGRVLAVGREAKEFLGRTPQKIVAIRPMKDGVIADFEVTNAMITFFIKKVIKGMNLIKPRIVICVPTGITQVEKRAVIESGMQSGAREVSLVEEPMSAAIGAGLPIEEPLGNLVVDIGGGTTEVAVILLSAVGYSESVRIAGDEMNEAIQRYIQDQYKLLIGENMSEKVKIAIGTASPMEETLTFNVMGKNMVNGNPKTITVSDGEIRECIQEPVNAIVQAVRRALEKTPPELVSDIADNGLLLAGGGALLKGLDKLITTETQVAVHIDPDPLTTVVRGAGLTLSDARKYRHVYIN